LKENVIVAVIISKKLWWIVLHDNPFPSSFNIWNFNSFYLYWLKYINWKTTLNTYHIQTLTERCYVCSYLSQYWRKTDRDLLQLWSGNLSVNCWHEHNTLYQYTGMKSDRVFLHLESWSRILMCLRDMLSIKNNKTQ